MARPTVYGQLSEFQPELESVKAYIERVKIFFLANEIEENKQLAVFLSTVGSKTYSLLRNLMMPDLPQDKSLAEVTAALENHFQPKPIVIAERFHFHKRNQLPSESVAEYVAELRRLSTHCDFGAYLSDALRDRLVCGLRSESVQKQLLAVKDLTFKDALDRAQAMEAADRNAKSLHVTEPAEVHRLTKTPQRRVPASKQSVNPTPLCYRCGKSNHDSAHCRFIDANCRACGKKGHIAIVCRSKKPGAQPRKPSSALPMNSKTHYVGTEDAGSPTEELHLFVIGANATKAQPIKCEVVIEGAPLTMEVDTGAEVSIIPDSTRKLLFPNVKLEKTNVVLKTYTEDIIPVVGELPVMVQYGTQAKQMKLIVVSGEGPSLLGRNWLQYLKLDWRQIGKVAMESATRLNSLLERHQVVFKDELGTVQEQKATLQVRPEASPKFHKARPVPFATKDAIGAELDRLEAEGILEKVSHSNWAAPIVAVPKKDGTFRICGDYKVTVNPALDVDQYPLPKPSDLFASLAGGQKFSVLDLSQAYQQLLLDEESKAYTTINTHKGLYQYTRLPFGIASAPAIFQKTMDVLLQGIPHVMCYIDDILVTGVDDTEHLRNLEEVLQRLEHYGLRVKKSKCEFMQPSVNYLGHRIDAQGLHTMPAKLDAIVQASAPENVKQLRSFLGLLNYYGSFIPNLATIVHPLNRLLRDDVTWKWDSKCAQAFTQAKLALTSSKVLVHYDPSLPITLAGDASAYGIGAVISHTLPDGSEHPIAFASHTLSPSEQNYAQLEKEALSLIFGVKKFHQYLYGRQFMLVTDHKPLMTILGPKKGIPSLAAARLQRWAVLLSAYRYDIKFKPTDAHANADGLSRLPLASSIMEGQSHEASTFNLAQMECLPVTATQVQQATRADPVLSKVLQYTRQGWPGIVPADLKPFETRRMELTVEGDCLLWGVRVVIPKKIQGRVLTELHSNHPGMSRMKAVARSYAWWPGLDQDIHDLVKGCIPCQSGKSAPAVAPLHPWVWPTKPWQRIHVDFAGPFLGKMFLVIVDAHSKWPEVFEMSSTTTGATIAVLRKVFATYGLPLHLVSDNGPQFVSSEFAHFMQANGVRHIRCAPYHPSSNGLAERFVRTFKQAMRAEDQCGTPVHRRLANFLLGYRTTPHGTTNRTPSSLFLGRDIRTRMDLLKPVCEEHVTNQQAQQVQSHDSRARAREFTVGQSVMARNFRPGSKWVPGVIVERQGPLSYLVKVQSGDHWKRHVDHLRERNAASETQSSDQPLPESDLDVVVHLPPTPPVVPQPSVVVDAPPAAPPLLSGDGTQPPPPRYPMRIRQPPQRFTPDGL